jgi:type IV pilus assembly protein PilO
MNDFIEQLRNLDMQDVGRWPFAFRAGAIALIFLIVASLLSYFFAWKSQKPVLEQARAQEIQLLGEFEKKQRKAANLQAYKDQLAEMEKSFGAMLRQLPNKTEVPNLLVDISQTGLAAGLEEKLFQPGNEVRRDFYAELPIKIRLTGNYHSIGQFVSGIAALPRIVTLHDIDLRPLDKKVGTGDLQFDVTAKTYRYLDEDEQAAIQAQQNARSGRQDPRRSNQGARARPNGQ